jgi:hypothetical protein
MRPRRELPDDEYGSPQDWIAHSVLVQLEWEAAENGDYEGAAEYRQKAKDLADLLTELEDDE